MTTVPPPRALALASWNVGHRLGRGTFRPEIADAVAALGADVVFLNEYYPRQHDGSVRDRLSEHGFTVDVSGPVTKAANLTLVASRGVAFERVDSGIEFFDEQMPSNTLALRLPMLDLTVIGMRIPMYTKAKAPLMTRAWDVLEAALGRLSTRRAVVIGDLNCSPERRRGRGRIHFQRILKAGWKRAGHEATVTFHSPKGAKTWVDHLLHTDHVAVTDFVALTRTGDFQLADGEGALSDHAAIRATVLPAVAPAANAKLAK